MIVALLAAWAALPTLAPPLASPDAEPQAGADALGRGIWPRMEGQGRATGLDGPFAGAPTLAWSIRLPGPPLNSASHTESGRPVIHGREILVGSAAGDALYRIDRFDGAVRGTFPASASVESEPLVHDGRVYFGDTSGTAWCYALDGELVWSARGNAPILTRPTVAGDRVIVSNVDDLVVALDRHTGAVQWRYKAKRDVALEAELALYAAPGPVVDGEVVLAGFSSGDLVALGLEDGAERWRMRVGEGRYPDLVATPTLAGEDVFVAGYFEPLVAIDRSSQNVRWRAQVGAAFPALLQDNTLIHPGSDGVLRAFSVLTGAERWAWSSGTSSALTQPIATQAGLVVAASGGAIYLVDPSNGRLLWSWQEPTLLEGIAATPVVEGRQLVFVTNAGRLYSMVAPAPAVRDRPSNRYPFRGGP